MAGEQQQQVQKNIVLAIQSDYVGTGEIRCCFNMNYLGAVFGPSNIVKPIITPTFIFDEHVLVQARSIYFQRAMNQEVIHVIEQYKRLQPKYKYKMVWDIDDYIWIENNESALPRYNCCSNNIKENQHNASIIIANMMDLCTVSTQFLKDTLIRLGVNSPIQVLPNVVPQYFYGNNKRQIKEAIKKPKIVYSGSPCHYHNDYKLYGDFANKAWVDWIIKHVKNDDIEMLVMGGLPFFWEELKGYKNFKVIDWVNSYQFHLPLLAYKPDISIMPIVPNNFNYGKSNLRYIEACALQAVGIGTVFQNGNPSPYDDNIIKVSETVTVDELDELLEKIKTVDFFNSTIKQQNDYIKENGLYLESKKHIDRLMSIY